MKRKETPSSLGVAPSPGKADLLHFADGFTVPAELVAAAHDNELVLYVGSGLSAPAGFPTWGSLVQSLVEWRRHDLHNQTDLLDSWAASLEAREYNSVAESVLSDPAVTPERLADFLRPQFQVEGQRSPWVEMLPSVRPSAILTTNFDDLLEKAFPSWLTFTPFDAESILEAHAGCSPHLVALYGHFKRPRTILLSPLQFELAMQENRRFANYMEAVFTTRTILFVGASVQGIVSYLRALRLNSAVLERHFALVANHEPGWRTRAEAIRQRFGIRFITFDAGEDYAAVGNFLTQLGDAIAAPSRQSNKRTQRKKTRAHLTRLEVEDIGPFSHQIFQFTPGWNMLIGDNGVGKSTILKALATAMCGDDAKSFAGRIVKSGATHGSITLHTSTGAVYRTDIFLKDALAEVRTIPARPLEAERWLALGFPPLRSMTWTRPQLLTAEGTKRLTAADLIPLLCGEPDTRSEGVKQWLLGLDYRIQQGGRIGVSARKLRDRFFQSIEKLLVGSSLRFSSVHPQTGEIRVATPEGELPLEAISQGAASLIGWVGVVLQRQADLGWEDESFPTLVLVDEIDAHMHPGWQWTLCELVDSLCPGVQFVATTHSPLIVGSLGKNEVHVLKRDCDRQLVSVKRVEESLRGYRADQILTHEIFGMRSTRSQATGRKLERYEQMLATGAGKPPTHEIKALACELQSEIPGPAESHEERLAQRHLQEYLETRLDILNPVEKNRVVAEAERLLAQLEAHPEGAELE